MDSILTAAAADPAFVAIAAGHLLVLLLSVLLTVLRTYAVGGFFAWLATITSLLLGVFWFLVLGGGRRNPNANESVRFALDPEGGLWVTLYIVIALVISYAMTWICKRGRERGAAPGVPATP